MLDPFRVRKFRRPENFQIPADEMEGSRVLDVGCGPVSKALSLVHCATVSAVDPLLNVYREMQPFGWDYFETAASVGAEELPFDDRSFDFVYCRNVLDHTRDADQVLREIVRVMPAQGQLLLTCDSRYGRGGGPAHPYAWTTETLQARVFEQFDPVTPISVRTTVGAWDGRGQRPVRIRWSGDGSAWAATKAPDRVAQLHPLVCQGRIYLARAIVRSHGPDPSIGFGEP